MKQISHEDKLEFYKTYNSEEFQNKLKKVKDNLFPIGYITLKVCFFVAFLGAIFNPWLLLLTIPGIITPLSVMAAGNFKQKLLIEAIHPFITYKDFKEMQKNGDWEKFGYESTAKEMKINHYAENSELIIEEENTKEEKIKNIPRSLNCCIIKEDNANLVQKTGKRHKKENHTTKTVVKSTIKEEDFNLTHNLLNNFVKENTNFTLKEYFPCKIFDVDKIYTVILKTPGGVELEFLVSYDTFECIDFSIDFTNDWNTYLNKQSTNENNI